MIRELENTPGLYHELSLFNKVGDLYLKTGAVQPAVEMYERAANHYAESGLPNNAIALCNKILRNAPGRTQVYLKLAQLMVQRGFVAEAKQNLLEYAERMQRAGKLEEAFEALKEFADLSPANDEIRLLLAEQLKAAARSDEAREQLNKLYSELQATGDTRRSRLTLEKIRAIDPEYDVGEPTPPATVVKGKTSDLVFLDLGDEPTVSRESVVEPQPIEDIRRSPVDDLEPVEVDEVDDELHIERTSAEFDLATGEHQTVEGLEIGGLEGTDAPELPPLEIETTGIGDPIFGPLDEEELTAPSIDFEEDDTDEEPLVADLPIIEMPDPEEDEGEPELEETEVSVDLPLIEGSFDFDEDEELSELSVDSFDLRGSASIEAPELDLGDEESDEEFELAPQGASTTLPLLDDVTVVEEEGATVLVLEDRVAENPDDPVLHRELGEALLENGERERGLEELDLALQLHESREEWTSVSALVDELLRLDPNSARYHQKRVELAFRASDKRLLVDAYLGLANALVRSDEVDRARLVYQRVLEHDPENELAIASLEALEPAVEEPAAHVERTVERSLAQEPPPRESGYVDLGALLLDEEDPLERDTRMRVEEEEPTGDEQKDFERMLSRFKRGIEVNVEEEDAQAHYDLGIAFKEMGLLDEAISEFQKALRASDGRLKTAEALGLCFFEKGQYSVAATVLRRAVDGEPGGDDMKIGLLYWLGRCEEELDRSAEALQHYQRVFAIDINFGDVGKRVRALAGAGS